MTTFVLVHGGYHGGWCCSRLVSELERRGHRAIAPDLPCDDAAAGYREYTATVLDAMSDLRPDQDFVLVGHSLGCYVAALVAEQRAPRHLFLLCAVPALPDTPIPMDTTSILTDELLAVTYFVDAAGRTMQSPAEFERIFYDDLAPDDAAWALRQLRPQGPRPLTEAWPLKSWPDVPRTIVLASDDRVVRFEAARIAAKELTGDDAVVLPGGHSIPLSSPSALADILLGTTRA